MATKLDRRPKAAPSKGRSSREQPDDRAALAILHPEATIEIGARVLEVREYGYVEGLKLQAIARPFLDELYALFDRAGGPPSADEISDIIVNHLITVQWMQAQSITPIVDDGDAFAEAVAGNARWIGTLTEDQGDLLMAAWWEVNKRFFTRRLQRRALAVRATRSVSSASTTA